MHVLKIVSAVVCIGVLAACATPQEKAAKAQAGAYQAQEAVAKQQETVVKRRLDLVAQYQKCVEQAAGDEQKVEACDSYLKAAEALK